MLEESCHGLMQRELGNWTNSQSCTKVLSFSPTITTQRSVPPFSFTRPHHWGPRANCFLRQDRLLRAYHSMLDDADTWLACGGTHICVRGVSEVEEEAEVASRCGFLIENVEISDPRKARNMGK